jgi:hypothetical protein
MALAGGGSAVPPMDVRDADCGDKGTTVPSFFFYQAYLP